MASEDANSLQSVIPQTPSADEWLTPAKVTDCQRLFESSVSFLRQAGLWKASLKYWVRVQVASEADVFSDSPIIDIDKLEDQWLKVNSLEGCSLTRPELRSKLLVGPMIGLWSRKNWAHRLNHLFLERKSALDKVSCWFLSIADKNLAQEIYHQIQANEISFQYAIDSISNSGITVKGAQLKNKPLSQLPDEIVQRISSLSPGKICMPMRIASGFCIIRLDEYVPASLDRNVEEILLAEQFSLWSESVVALLDSSFSRTEIQL